MSERRRVNRELEKFLSKAVSTVTKEVTRELVESTPRDTGFAAESWIPSIGQRAAPHDTPGTRAEKAQGVSGQTSRRNSGEASLAGYSIKKGDTFITNDVDYVRFLNAGSSSKAPSQFIESSIVSGIRSTDGKLRG